MRAKEPSSAKIFRHSFQSNRRALHVKEGRILDYFRHTGEKYSVNESYNKILEREWLSPARFEH